MGVKVVTEQEHTHSQATCWWKGLVIQGSSAFLVPLTPRVATKTTYEDQHHFGAPELITSSSLPSWGQGPLSAPTSAADIKADLGTWKHSGEPFPETWSFGAECYGPSCLAQGGGEVSGAGPSAHGNPIHLWLGYPVPQNWSTTGQGSLRRKVSLRPGNPFQSLRPALRTQPLTSQQLQCIQELSSRRLQRMPVQYILGEWDFQGLSLKMMPPVFIPRPETEELVEWVLEEVAQRSHAVGSPGSPLILEVGCGSGAISLSLLSQLPQSRVIAVDKGEAAISLTHENAQRLRLQDRIWIIHLDMTSEGSWTHLPWGPVDLVVSNPPYVFHQDMEQLAPEIHSYEDPAALDGGEEGMDIITHILALAPRLLKDCGSIFLEVDPRHLELVSSWLQSRPELYLNLVAVRRDFCGRPRFLHIRRSGP
uniref:MTRF1L release factor glutamine methyltransferase isoform X3 n=1 Tax=Callithrix jacchus TaxID=9483 RepID=UPI0012342E74|nr:MTRF1L release factor glutamine methyltransferase isoform X3 [Callithrix jacchus]